MFIKIIDEKTALKLQECGFVFTKEIINKGTVVYAFEKTTELQKELSQNFSSTTAFEEEILRFGGGVWTKV